MPALKLKQCSNVCSLTSRLGKDAHTLTMRVVQEDAGGGLVFWQPKGAAVRNIVETFWKEIHMARGYSLLYTPHVAKVDLWKTSGHYDHYGENMFDQMQVCIRVEFCPLPAFALTPDCECSHLGTRCGRQHADKRIHWH